MSSIRPRPPSARLIRAAAAERAELARERERILRERESLRAELDRIEQSLAEIEHRWRLLDQLAPQPTVADQSTDARPAGTPSPPTTELRGPAIREVAVRLLIDHPQRPEAMHYRKWFELLLGSGHTVSGKNPLAVFLTQVSRSPALRKGTQAGVYELDRRAPANLRRRLEKLQGEMRELTRAPAGTADLADIRAHRADLTAEIGRVEKALEEVGRLLRADMSPALSAAG